MAPDAAEPGWRGTLACAMGATTWRRGGPPGLGSRRTGRRALRQRLAGRLVLTPLAALDMTDPMEKPAAETNTVDSRISDADNMVATEQVKDTEHAFVAEASDEEQLRSYTSDACEEEHDDFWDEDWLEDSEVLLRARLDGARDSCTAMEVDNMARIFDLFDGSTAEELVDAFSGEGGLAFCDTEEDLLSLVPFLLRAAATSLRDHHERVRASVDVREVRSAAPQVQGALHDGVLHDVPRGLRAQGGECCRGNDQDEEDDSVRGLVPTQVQVRHQLAASVCGSWWRPGQGDACML